jgi:hypothetical protein
MFGTSLTQSFSKLTGGMTAAMKLSDGRPVFTHTRDGCSLGKNEAVSQYKDADNKGHPQAILMFASNSGYRQSNMKWIYNSSTGIMIHSGSRHILAHLHYIRSPTYNHETASASSRVCHDDSS